MNRNQEFIRRQIISVGLVAFFCLHLGVVLLLASSPGYYLPADPPSIASILHETVEDVPTPKSRLDIGIYEAVQLSIDPATWIDLDHYVEQDGSLTPTYDSMGEVIWTANGAGAVYPTVGISTLLIAEGVSADSPVSALATIFDSGTKGLDQPVILQVQMQVRVPNAIQGVVLRDNPGLGMVGPPNNQIGAFSRFWYQITPANVNFALSPLRENIPAVAINWPDGTNENVAARVVPFNCFNLVILGPPALLVPNMVLDNISSGLRPVARLGAPAVAFNYNVPVPLEYQANNAGWVLFANTNHPREYDATLRARVGLNGVWGGWQGPWR